MKKRNLLLFIFLTAFSSCFAQNNSSNENQPKKAELKVVHPQKQAVVKKSTIQKAVKVQALDIEKQKATTKPKQKAKLDDSNI